MIYYTINYNTLKNYILNNKDKYNLTDIYYLLDNGLINQQQYEDLATIVHRAQYKILSFLDQDKGYYHQQGPLTQQQALKDLTAGRKSRLRKRGHIDAA